MAVEEEEVAGGGGAVAGRGKVDKVEEVATGTNALICDLIPMSFIAKHSVSGGLAWRECHVVIMP